MISESGESLAVEMAKQQAKNYFQILGYGFAKELAYGAKYDKEKDRVPQFSKEMSKESMKTRPNEFGLRLEEEIQKGMWDEAIKLSRSKFLLKPHCKVFRKVQNV